MKCKTIIDKNREEEVIIYAHERNETVESIERIVSSTQLELIGYSGKSAVKLEWSEVYCFSVEDNRVYAVTEKEALPISNYYLFD